MKNMTALLTLFSLLWVLMGCGGNQTTGQPPSTSSEVLVFTKTEGFRHSSIPNAVSALQELAAGESAFSITATEDASTFTTSNLENYGAVLFLNTSGDVLNGSQQNALQAFIQGGGGFMGVHAATDTEFDWPWYGRMIGARFKNHPQIQQADLQVLRNNHPATEYLPGRWTRTDEWYNFTELQSSIIPLINLDESSYEGGENGQTHPIAWYQNFEGGRVFYTGGGHTTESYDDPTFVRHLRGGILYVLGN